MRVNIYYGGRGLIDDPTLFVIEKMTKVLEELRVTVERHNLYEEKNSIAVLPKTLKEVDGVILAVSVEWFGFGGYMQQFLDSCWLYGDKELISHIYMFPVVMATTYGEREAEYSLIRAWEMLGGAPSEGLCAYVDDHVEFETNADYNLMIEKKTENFYRTISRKSVAFPNSNMQIKKSVLRGSTLSLTPQESEQLSAYVSNDNYVKKQKEDIEELASLFKGMLGEGGSGDDYINRFTRHFSPDKNMQASLYVEITDREENLVLDIQGEQLNCYQGTSNHADVKMKVRSDILEEILNGSKTFQGAFMSGDLSAQGDFNLLREVDTLFRF